MSHFVVVCATHTSDELELDELLAPYDENLEVEESEDDEGNTYMYNPDAKWDWWTVGGRWSDYFILKDGTKANSAQKSEIDFKTKRSELVASARKRWILMDEAFKDLPPTKPWSFWYSQYTDGKIPLDDARNQYHNQPRTKAANELPKDLFGWFPIEFLNDYESFDEEGYVKNARMSCYCGYAYLDADTGWLAKGEMGWFGIGNEDINSETDYFTAFAKIIDQLPDDMFLTAVDCHT